MAPACRLSRKQRLRQLEREYGDRLDQVTDFLADFAAQIKAIGPKTYLGLQRPRRQTRQAERALQAFPRSPSLKAFLPLGHRGGHALARPNWWKSLRPSARTEATCGAADERRPGSDKDLAPVEPLAC